jgi:hypothetical protein
VELRKVDREKGELNIPIIYFLISVFIGIFTGSLYLLNRVPFIPCLFKRITGIPCPSCGATRMCFSLLHREIVSAFLFNPLMFLGGIVFFLWIAYGFYMWFSKKKILLKFTKGETLIMKLFLLTLFLLNWCYLIISEI